MDTDRARTSAEILALLHGVLVQPCVLHISGSEIGERTVDMRATFSLTVRRKKHYNIVYLTCRYARDL